MVPDYTKLRNERPHEQQIRFKECYVIRTGRRRSDQLRNLESATGFQALYDRHLT